MLERKANSSMQLTRAADYAVRVMVFLAEQRPNARLSLAELARGTGAPESFLSKVMQALSRGSLITSQRGHSGGFSIGPRGLQASMRDVIEAVNGPIRLNVCLGSNTACARQSWCPAHPVWIRAQQAMLKVLDDARVAELGQCDMIPEMAVAAGFSRQRRCDSR
jgi:Rrf2 family protein